MEEQISPKALVARYNNSEDSANNHVGPQQLSTHHCLQNLKLLNLDPKNPIRVFPNFHAKAHATAHSQERDGRGCSAYQAVEDRTTDCVLQEDQMDMEALGSGCCICFEAARP